MKTFKILLALVFVLLCAGSVPALDLDQCEIIEAKDKKWIKLKTTELYQNINKLAYKKIYFEIKKLKDDQYSNKPKDDNYYNINYLKKYYMGKQYTCFCVSGKAGGYLWVRISKDKIIAALKKVKTGELKLGVFAKVKRKKHSNSPTSNYKYFVIVEALTKTKINKIPPPAALKGLPKD